MTPRTPRSGFTFDGEGIRQAVKGIDELSARVGKFQRSADDAADSLSGFHPWGAIGEIYLRRETDELMAECQEHLRHLRKAFSGARDHLDQTGKTYATAETASAVLLSKVGNDGRAAEQNRLRQLNPASRFYRDHRLLNGLITEGPFPFNCIGSSVIHTLRFMGDLRSDDHYNIATDIANLAVDAPLGIVSFLEFYNTMRANPLNYLIRTIPYGILGSMYWTKWVADWVTGDPIATGQAAYNFDSIAEGCRRLAQELTDGLDESLSGGRAWGGTTAEGAADRLGTFRDGITETGNHADSVAAILQLASSIMGTVEGIVKGLIADLISWAVQIWFAAQLTVGISAGTSEIAAAAQISERSAATASEVSGLLRRVAALLRRLASLMKRLVQALDKGRRRAFIALSRSSVGQKTLAHPYGSGYIGELARLDIGIKKHAHLYPTYVVRGTLKQFSRSPAIRALSEFGFTRTAKNKRGELNPGGRYKIHPFRYPVGKNSRLITIYPIIAPFALRTLAPFGRALQYHLRADDASSDEATDRKLDVLG